MVGLTHYVLLYISIRKTFTYLIFNFLIRVRNDGIASRRCVVYCISANFILTIHTGCKVLYAFIWILIHTYQHISADYSVLFFYGKLFLWPKSLCLQAYPWMMTRELDGTKAISLHHYTPISGNYCHFRDFWREFYNFSISRGSRAIIPMLFKSIWWVF